MINIILLAILILPWLIIPVDGIPEPTRLIKACFFDFTMMAVIVFALIDGLKFGYKNKYLGWICAWVFFTMACNWYYPLVRGFGYNAGTIDGSLHFILGVIGTICVCSTFEKTDYIRIAKATALSATLVASFALLQFIGLDPMTGISKHRIIPGDHTHRYVAALLDHPDLLGNYLAICLPFFFYLKGIRYILSLALIVFIIFVTQSSLSIVAVCMAFLIFMLLKNRDSFIWKFSLSGLFVAFMVAAISIKGFNKFHGGFTGRTTAWQEMIHRMSNPAFGQGIGIVKSLLVKTGNNYWMFAHNDYLEIYCALGVLGLFLVILLIINSIRNFNYKKENILGFSFLASFIAFLIVMFGSFPMEIAPLALGGLIAFWGVEKT